MTLADEVAEALRTLNDLIALAAAGEVVARFQMDAAILRYGDLCKRLGGEEAKIPLMKRRMDI